MADLHLDQDIRIDNQRCAAIIMKDGKFLLMHRIKKGDEYYTFIGGHRQEGEEILATLNREVGEEASVTVKNTRLVFEFKDYERNNYDYYFLCEWESGEPKLGGEEEIKNSLENFYKLEWISPEEFIKLEVVPTFAKHWVIDVVIENLKNE